MLLVPRQLRRSGMTGDVPYYGGRLTPAQAYAASHPSRPVPAGAVRDRTATYRALDQLLADGVISAQEHAALLARVTS